MGTSWLYLRPGYPPTTEESCRPQAQEGHGEFDRAPRASRSQPTVGRAVLPPLQLLVLLLLALLSPGPCCGFHAGFPVTAGGLTSPLQQHHHQQHRFTGCCLDRSPSSASRGGAIHPVAAAAGDGGESYPIPHPPLVCGARSRLVKV